MLALGIRYLTGYVAAADAASFDAVEWPPHPGRVFMALAAAHFETGGAVREREALEWLETQSAPFVLAGGCAVRQVMTTYVPANDKAEPLKGSGKGQKPLMAAQSMPLGRNRQPRTFPRAWLDESQDHDQVHLVWRQASPSADVLAALASLCEKVTRIGHSSSLVQMWLCDKVESRTLLEVATGKRAEPNRRAWQPGDDHPSASRLRVTGERLLDYLQERFEQPERPLRPTLGRAVGYAVRERIPHPPAGTIFDPRLVVLRLSPRDTRFRRLGLVSTLAVTSAMHRALIAQAERFGGAPEALSGHRSDGRPTAEPHVAFLPAPFVGHPHADGHLMGVALALPAGLTRDQLRLISAAIFGLEEHGLRVSRSLGIWTARRADAETPKANLRPVTWVGDTGGARAWASITPVAFDRHPKARGRVARDEETAAWVGRACRDQMGLPEPVAVRLTPVSAHLGAPAARDFPRLRRKNGTERRHCNVILRFDEPVRGPILLGAGRFRGYGLFRPLGEEDGTP